MDEKEVLVDLSEEDAIASDLSLESSSEPNPFVLGQLVGPFMMIEEDNGNDRYYLKETIQKGIVDNDYVKSMMANKALLGESHHPLDRTSIWSDESCISTRELWIDSTGKTLMGRADILDTPKGRIVYALAKYGTKLGISARANGKGVKQGSHLVIKPENYFFKTFDVVLNPGFPQARPTITEADGKTPMKVYEEQGEFDVDGLYEELEGMVKNKSCDTKLLSDYIKYSENEKLNGLLPLLEEDSTESSDDTSLQKLEEENESLKAKVAHLEAYKANIQTDMQNYKESVTLLEEDNEALKSLKKSLEERPSADATLEELLEEVSNSRNIIKKLSEQIESYKELVNLMESYGIEGTSQLTESTDELAKAHVRIDELTEEIGSLQEQHRLDEEAISAEQRLSEESVKTPVIKKKMDLFDNTEVLNEEKKDINMSRVNMIRRVGGM